MLDQFHTHEALDRCHTLQVMLQELLLSHPFILAEVEYKEKLEKASDLIGEVYQAIGDSHIPDEEEWIPHLGGDCPVSKGTLITVRYRDGIEKTCRALIAYGDFSRDASSAFWSNDGYPNDIVAYKLEE